MFKTPSPHPNKETVILIFTLFSVIILYIVNTFIILSTYKQASTRNPTTANSPLIDTSVVDQAIQIITSPDSHPTD